MQTIPAEETLRRRWLSTIVEVAGSYLATAVLKTMASGSYWPDGIVQNNTVSLNIEQVSSFVGGVPEPSPSTEPYSRSFPDSSDCRKVVGLFSFLVPARSARVVVSGLWKGGAFFPETNGRVGRVAAKAADANHKCGCKDCGPEDSADHVLALSFGSTRPMARL